MAIATPLESELWTLINQSVLICELFIDNLRTFSGGEELRNVVNRAHFYRFDPLPTTDYRLSAIERKRA